MQIYGQASKSHTYGVLSSLRRVRGSGPADAKILHEDTRVELLQDLRGWYEDSRFPVFWLRGGAGTGKSTLAGQVVKQAREEGYLGGRFFFSFEKKGLGSVDDLWTTFASTLAETYAPFCRHLADALTNNPSLLTDDPKQQLKGLIINPLRLAYQEHPGCQPLLFVIDALDECDPEGRSQFFDGLPELCKVPIVKILITSRPESTHAGASNIVARMEKLEISEVDVEEFDATTCALVTRMRKLEVKMGEFGDSRADIATYILSRLRDIKVPGLERESDEEEMTGASSCGRWTLATKSCRLRIQLAQSTTSYSHKIGRDWFPNPNTSTYGTYPPASKS